MPPLGLGAGGFGHFHLHRKRALLVGEQRTDADHLAGDFLAAVVADRQHHGIFVCQVARGRCDRAFYLQRRIAGLGTLQGRLVEAQVAAASRAHAGAFEDGGLAMRAGACRARGARTRCTHESRLASVLPLVGLPVAALSSQPNSICPRIREPAATVSEPALRSPVSTPDSSSSTRCAPSMLPSSSPAMVTLLARTPPVTLAPFSMVRSPSTLTSPLNWPAIRTCPLPWILPSMVRSAAISDSLSSRVAARAGVAAVAGAGALAWAKGSDSVKRGVSVRAGSFRVVSGAIGAG